MAQESGSQNKTVEFLKNNPIYVIVGLLAIMLVVYLIATGGDNGASDDTTGEQGQEQVENGQQNNDGQNGEEDTNQNGDDQTGDETDSQDNQTGANVNISGTLRESDNADLGNLMVESSSGKIYVNTARDFAALVGTRVRLNAEGSLNEFRFIGFNDDSKISDGTDETARGGESETRNVSFTGTLRSSDNSSKGDYVISSGGTDVYFQTARDYSSWVDQQVTLQASGTLNSFTNALLVR